ncbi:terpene synthase 1-like [Aristolochia californica]|uniref:terpene synthase 1-like n=1 Tax=Aristolochia californica TaxID=171875 RepID=UPI0035E03042
MALVTPTPVTSTVPQAENEKSQIVRPVAQFPPSAWGHYFVDLVQDEENLDQWAKRAEVLKEEVKEILKHAQGTPDEIYLLDAVYRLGLNYQFEKEIDDALQRIHSTSSDDVDADDLYSVATRFRVLREGGYKASADVFRKFLDEQGKFKQSLTTDVKGLLSLHEAAFLSVQGEDILDEAVAFTSEQLKSALSNMDPSLAKQVARAIKIPTHRRLPRLNARYFISVYEEINTCNPVLLEYAKLDYNLVQAVHQREIKAISKWWKDQELAEKCFYARNRVVECYFWIMSVTFDPRYSRSRVFASKILGLISLIDDTYDAYGVFEELKQFTDAVERWDVEAAETLPEYMRPLFLELITYTKEFHDEIAPEGLSYQIDYMIEAMKDLCKAFFVETEWYVNQYQPGTEEHMRVSFTSCGYRTIFLLSMVGMGEISSDIFEWLKTQPRVTMAAAEICRFIDDIVTGKFEQQRGHVESTVECFMRERGLSEQEVVDLFRQYYAVAWKDINEGCFKPTPYAAKLITRPVNLARVMEVLYEDNKDGYTFSHGRTKAMIASLVVDPVPL